MQSITTSKDSLTITSMQRQMKSSSHTLILAVNWKTLSICKYKQLQSHSSLEDLKIFF